MSIYSDLSELSDKFQVVQSTKTINAASTLQLLDYSNIRVYLAFSWQINLAAPMFFTPLDATGTIGFGVQGVPSYIEFFIEKTKSLSQQKWFCKNTGTVAITVNIIEVLVKVIEPNDAQGLRD